MQDDLYREEMLDHYKNPLNFGKLETYSISSKQKNPFCGDEVEMFIKWDKGKKENIRVEKISFRGTGCAICIASASLLTEHVKGKTKKELTKFSEVDMLRLLGAHISETRKKCALLSLFTLKDCLGMSS